MAGGGWLCPIRAQVSRRRRCRQRRPLVGFAGARPRSGAWLRRAKALACDWRGCTARDILPRKSFQGPPRLTVDGSQLSLLREADGQGGTMKDRQAASYEENAATYEEDEGNEKKRDKGLLRIFISYASDDHERTNFARLLASDVASIRYSTPSWFLTPHHTSIRYNSLSLRNALVHKPYLPATALLDDQLNLSRDQEEISDDFRIAVLKLLAQERPDLLLIAALEILDREQDSKQKTRSYKLLIKALRGIIESPRDKEEAQENADASEADGVDPKS